MVQPGRAQITRRMRTACWVPKAKNTHSEYVIFISFPLQQCLQERVWVLRYTCIAVLVHTQLLHSMAQKYLYSTARNVHVPFNFIARIL
jgi:hypothetical protein